MNFSLILLPVLLGFAVGETPVRFLAAQSLPAAGQVPASGAQTSGQQTASSGPERTEPSASPQTTPSPLNPAPKPQAPASSANNVSDALPPPPQPKTEILDASATSAAVATDGHDPILDPPPFPKGTTTLVGGTISGVDRIRNHLTLAVFGHGGDWIVYFDERTHIFRNGAEATPLALRKGERVYVDTMLDNNKHDVFARNIRVGVVVPLADAAGQLVEVDVGRGEVVLRDNVNSASVRFGVNSDTRISHGSKPATFRDLVAGALVRVQFAPDRSNRGVAREIAILALPGAVFSFAGTITFLDTHRNLFSLRSSEDDKTYDIYFIPARVDAVGRLAVGARVQVRAVFETTRYTAQQIDVIPSAGEPVP